MCSSTASGLDCWPALSTLLCPQGVTIRTYEHLFHSFPIAHPLAVRVGRLENSKTCPPDSVVDFKKYLVDNELPELSALKVEVKALASGFPMPGL